MPELTTAIAMPVRDRIEPETQLCLDHHLPANVVAILTEVGTRRGKDVFGHAEKVNSYD